MRLMPSSSIPKAAPEPNWNSWNAARYDSSPRVIVLFAGVFGAMVATPLLNALKIDDFRARGFATGVSAHGIGAARAFQVDATAGAFASLGMALNAVVTATLLSVLALLI